jgi:hypothetical protein
VIEMCTATTSAQSAAGSSVQPEAVWLLCAPSERAYTMLQQGPSRQEPLLDWFHRQAGPQGQTVVAGGIASAVGQLFFAPPRPDVAAGVCAGTGAWDSIQVVGRARFVGLALCSSSSTSNTASADASNSCGLDTSQADAPSSAPGAGAGGGHAPIAVGPPPVAGVRAGAMSMRGVGPKQVRGADR